MSFGYLGEFVANERSQGFMVGLAIPLWQNKNVVKQARAEALSSESMAEDSRVRYYNHLRSLYNQAVGLQQSVNLYTASLNENGHDSLLLKAFEKGELSLLEYLLEMEYFYECFRKRSIAERLSSPFGGTYSLYFVAFCGNRWFALPIAFFIKNHRICNCLRIKRLFGLHENWVTR